MIRIADESDLKAVFDLVNCCIQDMKTKDLEQWPDWYPNKNILLDDIKASGLYLAEKDQEIIGIIVLNPEVPEEYNTIKWKWSSGRVNSIHRLAVHPENKTPGLAKELVRYVEGIANKKGYNIIRLDTYSKNIAAGKFYRKMGYRYSGDIKLKFMPEHYHCFEKAL
jgi:ribosomal protein S18 acetylase RimI-like enzyme